MTTSKTLLLTVSAVVWAGFAVAQTVELTPQERVAEAATQIEILIGTLRERSAAYPEFITDLQEGLLTIEQADERVQELIALLTEATDRMQDTSDIATAIDDYSDATQQLISEAEASTNETIRATVPALTATLENLQNTDRDRAEMVIEARNLIRELEADQEALAFLIRANQVQQAADLIADNVAEFAGLLDTGQALTETLLGTVDTVER